MSANLLRLPDEIPLRYKSTAEHLNAERAKKGLKPIKPTELMRDVLARAVGLPVAHEIAPDELTAAAKQAAKKAPAKQAAKKAPAKQAAKKAPAKQADMTTPPHGGKTAAKRTSKKAPAKQATTTADMWTRPHGG
jgi:large subunit ribosomal protein L22e